MGVPEVRPPKLPRVRGLLDQVLRLGKSILPGPARKNKGHHTAVRALAFKWMRILFACWKNRKPYDDAVHSARLQQHGLAFAGE